MHRARSAIRPAITVFTATLLAVALAVFGLGSATAGAAATWVGTATRADSLARAVALGREPGSTPLHVAVALNLRNVAALEHSVAAGNVLTPAQFVTGYAPTATQVSGVVSYLAEHGFTGVDAASNRLLVTANATVAQASAAFDTVIEQYRQNGRVVYANSADAKVPASLAGIVSSVLGLNDVGVMHAQPLVSKDPPSSCTISVVGYPCTYAPQGFWRAYDAVSAPKGAATSIAIFAEGDLAGVVKDLRTEETAAGLPQVPVTVVQVGAKSTDTSGADEFDLDTQFSTGMAGTVKNLYVYDAASLSDAALTASFNRFASQDVAKAGSASFGECEFQADLDGSLTADDHAFLEAAAQGQTVFASAGDTGGFCPVGAAVNGVPGGAPDVSYPASSPWVVGVGGTTLATNADGTYKSEIAWVAGGGGPSLFEREPAFQDGIAPQLGTVCSTLTVACGRTVPDVSMDADPNSGANVYVGGTPEGVGGTSLASPLALGVWARVESAHANGIGFADPRLYAVHSTAAFHDVELGDTGPYPATPGYDLATGIGTFDVAKLVSAIK